MLLISYLTKFLDLILGDFTAAPQILAPVINIPLNYILIYLKFKFYQAAPTTDTPIANATPIFAQKYGDIQLNKSPYPVMVVTGLYVQTCI